MKQKTIRQVYISSIRIKVCLLNYDNFINNLPNNVVGIEVTGDVTKEEYDSLILPKMNELVNKQSEINYLVVLKSDVAAFGAGVWWDDFKLALKHFKEWHKIAIVSDQEGVAKLTSMFSFAFPGDSKGFKLDEYDAAVKWVTT